MAASRGVAGRTEDGLDALRSEIACLKKISHPHIVQLFEVMNDPNCDVVYMVFELLLRGSLLACACASVPHRSACVRL
jgi:serine/threonine protein kinase